MMVVLMVDRTTRSYIGRGRFGGWFFCHELCGLWDVGGVNVVVVVVCVVAVEVTMKGREEVRGRKEGRKEGTHRKDDRVFVV
jgi:hypothetical protein